MTSGSASWASAAKTDRVVDEEAWNQRRFAKNTGRSTDITLLLPTRTAHDGAFLRRIRCAPSIKSRFLFTIGFSIHYSIGWFRISYQPPGLLQRLLIADAQQERSSDNIRCAARTQSNPHRRLPTSIQPHVPIFPACSLATHRFSHTPGYATLALSVPTAATRLVRRITSVNQNQQTNWKGAEAQDKRNDLWERTHRCPA